MNRLGQSLYDRSPVWVQNELCTFWGRRLERQRYGPAYDRWAAAWADSRTWSEARLLEYQRAQVRELLAHCAATVPYHAEAWRAAGVKPDDFRDLPDLARFPETTKDQWLDAGPRMLSRLYDPRSLVTVTTGGTTGTPLTLYRTREEMQRHYAVIWDRMRQGVARGDRYAAFQGKEIVPQGQSGPPYWRENRAANQRLYSMRHLAPAKLEHYARSLVETPFVYYQGYANFMSVVAEYMADHGLAPRTPPRAVFSTSDQLSAGTRRLMEQVWRTRVWDEYGQAEYGALIRECEHGGRHAQMDYGVVEYLPAGEEGGLQLFELVCTGFIPRAMPVVRYRVGDQVLVQPGERCPCGAPGPVIRAIRGRTSEFIVTPEGRRYPTITHFVDLLHNVRRTQVVQERADEIVVRVLPLPGFGEADERLAVKVFEERLGPGLKVRVERVAELERMPNGKVLNIINRMPGYRRGTLAATESD